MDLRAFLFLVSLQNCLYNITQPKQLLNLSLPYILSVCAESRWERRRNSHCRQTKSNLHWFFHWLAIHVIQENWHNTEQCCCSDTGTANTDCSINTLQGNSLPTVSSMSCMAVAAISWQYLGFLHLTSEEQILYGSLVYRACIHLVNGIV